MIGRRLGHYRVVEKLGAGGMGEVYLAQDSKLRRQVALKVLPSEMAADPERRARFEREARAVAALNHPNIVTIFSVEESAGTHFLTMEFVQGKSLATLIPAEGMPLDRLFEVGIPLVDAVSTAHKQGITHRDLKPDNVMITSENRIKVLDFGLAKLRDDAGPMQAGATVLTTTSNSVTREGMILGTINYMSPEQAEGKPVDERSDIFSLGILLYEMATGRRPFVGDTPVSTISSILKDTPPSIAEIRQALPRHLSRVVSRCLAKEPERRYQTAIDVRTELEELRQETDSDTPQRTPARAKLAGLVAVVALLVTVGVFLFTRGDRPTVLSAGSTQPVTRAPELELDPAISPDGSMIAYAAGMPGRMTVQVRQIESGATLALTGESAGEARLPRWSPDGTQLLFQSDGVIYAVPVLGGEPHRLLRATVYSAAASADWSPDGSSIAYLEQSSNGRLSPGAIFVKPVAKGEPRKIADAFEAHSLRWSPDGSRLAYVSGGWAFAFGARELGNVDPSTLWVVRVGDGEPVKVTSGEHFDTCPVWMPDGETLLFVSNRDGANDVYQVALDDSGAPTAPPVRITTGLGAQSIDVARDGSRLVYSVFTHRANIYSLPIPTGGEVSISGAEAVTRERQIVEAVEPSPDGERLAFCADREGNQEIYTMPAAGGEPRRLTTHPQDDYRPAWSPDGTGIAFYSLRSGNRDLFTMTAEGEELRQITDDPAQDRHPDWSPDGNRIAFESDRTGRPEIFVIERDPRTQEWGNVRQLSTDGGYGPVWSPTDDLIAYTAPPQDVRVASPATGESRSLVQFSDYPEWVQWSTDGGTIYFAATDGKERLDLWEVAAAGGSPRRLVRFDDPVLQFARSDFSAGAERFYFVINQFESDIWSLTLAASR